MKKLFLLLSIFTYGTKLTCKSQTINFGINKAVEVDTSVNKIYLNDYKGLTQMFGKKFIEKINSSEKIFQTEPDPYFIVKSNDSKEYLRIVVKGDHNCCNYFEVGYINKILLKKAKKKLCNSFITNNGIKLGLQIDEFKTIMKGAYFYSNVGNLAIYRQLSQTIWQRDSALMIKELGDNVTKNEINKLKDRYNYMYEYVSEYVFLHNKLVLFGFGTTSYFPERQEFLPFSDVTAKTDGYE